jgi:hypothetical protein
MEVLVALGVLILGLSVLGSQIHTGRQASQLMERDYTALLLAESKIAELDTGLVVPDDIVEGDWGELFPRFGWRMTMEPSGVPLLTAIRLQILYDGRRWNVDEEMDYDNAEVLQTVHLLRATPARIDLTRDFGMKAEDAENLAEQLSGVGQEGLNPYDLDPALFRDLTLEELIEVLPALLQAFGMRLEDVLPMLPDDLRQLMDGAGEEADFDDEDDGAGAPSDAPGSRGQPGPDGVGGPPQPGPPRRGGEDGRGVRDGDARDGSGGDPSAGPPRRGGRPPADAIEPADGGGRRRGQGNRGGDRGTRREEIQAQ